MRRIVQIGTGRQTWINFREGDVFLGCEPMYSEMRELHEIDVVPDFVEHYIYEGLIGSKKFKGTAKYAYPKTHYEKGFILESGKRRPSAYNVIEKPCIMLDELLERYEAHGFTESIYFLNVGFGHIGLDVIFAEYSWRVKPKIFTTINCNRKEMLSIFEGQGYDVLKDQNPFLAVLRGSDV